MVEEFPCGGVMLKETLQFSECLCAGDNHALEDRKLALELAEKQAIWGTTRTPPFRNMLEPSAKCRHSRPLWASSWESY